MTTGINELDAVSVGTQKQEIAKQLAEVNKNIKELDAEMQVCRYIGTQSSAAVGAIPNIRDNIKKLSSSVSNTQPKTRDGSIAKTRVVDTLSALDRHLNASLVDITAAHKNMERTYADLQKRKNVEVEKGKALVNRGKSLKGETPGLNNDLMDEIKSIFST